MGKTRAHYQMVREDDPDFARFWDAYPKRLSKKEARKTWLKLNPPSALVDRMVDALAWQVPTYRWDGDKWDYAPYPASWLNGERWTDSPPPNVKTKALSQAVSDPMRAWLEGKGVGS